MAREGISKRTWERRRSVKSLSHLTEAMAYVKRARNWLLASKIDDAVAPLSSTSKFPMLARVDRFSMRVPPPLLLPWVADEELGDTLEIVEQRAAAGEPERALVVYFVWRLILAIVSTQRHRVTAMLTRRELK